MILVNGHTMQICATRLLLVVLGALLPACASAQTTGYAASHGVELYYHTYGEGTPLLVLNGGPGISSQHFGGLARQLADLKPGYRVILFDQRGTGRSTLEREDSTTVNVALMVADIEALREHLGIEAWTVFGHSWGGMYAMLYATTYPDRVQGLILSDSGGSTLEWLQYAGDNIRMRLGPERRASYEYWLDPANAQADPERANLERIKALAAAYVYNPEHIPFVVEALSGPALTSAKCAASSTPTCAAPGMTCVMSLRRSGSPRLFYTVVRISSARWSPTGRTRFYRTPTSCGSTGAAIIRGWTALRSILKRYVPFWQSADASRAAAGLLIAVR